MKLKTVLSVILAVSIFSLIAQNNLVHSDGYETGTWGELTEIKKSGSGDHTFIVIPGWGFDISVVENFIDSFESNNTIYSITIPGFGDTKAPPMPKNGSYKELNWTKGVIEGIKNLIDEEGIENPTIVSYFTYSNVIAMRLALDYPDKVGKLIIVSGMAKFTGKYPSYEPSSLSQRIFVTEGYMANQWFKNVSKVGWDDGNFVPETFSKDSAIAQKRWEQMSKVPMPVMIRYLLEYYCTDLSLEYSKLEVPTLVVLPAFTEETLNKPGNKYLTGHFHHSWWGAKPQSSKIQMIAVNETNAFILDDQPDVLTKLIQDYLAGVLNPFEMER